MVQDTSQLHLFWVVFDNVFLIHAPSHHQKVVELVRANIVDDVGEHPKDRIRASSVIVHWYLLRLPVCNSSR